MKTDLRRRGKAKAGLIVALVVVLAIAVPVGLYMLGQVAFPNGTTGQDLSVPNTGVPNSAQQASNAAPQVGTSPPQVAAAAPQPATPKRRVVAPADVIPADAKTMDLLVIDEITKQPIAGIRAQTNGNGMQRPYNGRTGADGHVKLPIPSEKNPNYFNIRITGKNYLDKRLEWVSYQPELAGEVPTTCTIAMEHTTKISGKIVDDSGQPVAGATVILQFDKKYANAHEHVAQTAYNPRSARNAIKTGADGSWSFSGAPLNSDSISMVAWDYQHVSDDYFQPQPFADVAKLYDGTAVYTMHNGLTLDGVVTGPDGSPLAGVSVLRGQQAQIGNGIPPQITDAAGKFSYAFSTGQQVILTFTARGYAPEMKQLTMGSQKQTLAVSLSKPHRIYGKVVDGSGKGVPNVGFYLRSWRGSQSINANFQTDSSGNFHWNEAPADTVTFEVSAQGLRGINEKALDPDKDNTITLGVGSKVHGIVTDAVTGTPIDKFSLIFGVVWNEGQQTVWQPAEWANQVRMSPGKFDFTDEYPYPGISVKVEAPGHWPAESRIIKPSESGEITIELKLKPGQDLIATVRTPDGNPVANALVVMAVPGNQAYIDNFKAVRSQTAQQTTGADGKVDFPPGSEKFKLVAMADAGYAVVDQTAFAKSSDITLAPWGRIEGQLMVGSKPGSGLTVDVQQPQMGFDQNEPQVFHQISATTDGDGKFVVDRIPAGTWTVYRRIPFGNNGWSDQSLDSVDVSAGKTATISIGGKGRSVVGKVVIPPELAARTDWSYSFCNITTRGADMALESLPMPDEIKAATPEKQQAWIRQWIQTDAGRAYMAKQQALQAKQRNYPIAVNADGTFRADDVQPGDYEISINLRSNDNSIQNGRMAEVGQGYAKFTMPPIAPGQSDEPLQLDPITVMKLGKYAVGDTVYDLPLKSFDGKDMKLSDFRGKYLLLDFRQVADPSLAPLKAVYAGYGQNSQLQMLTILFSYGGPLAKTSALSGIDWPQAQMIPDRVNWVVLGADFAVRQSRNAWLIGPDGKVVGADLSGDAIQAAVSAALGAPAEPAATQPATMP